MSEFEAFAEAVAGQSTSHAVTTPDPVASMAVLGGGSDARLIAALGLAAGIEVSLFSAYGAELDQLRASSGIALRDAGPVGTYQIDNPQAPSVKTTAELDRAVSAAEVLFLTGPVHKQRTYAMVLADHLHDGQVLVLAPGRSLGALETAWLLRVGGCTADITIVETQGLPYWCKANGAVLSLSQAAPVAAATLPGGRIDVLQKLAPVLGELQAADSVLTSGFADGSALVEIPALLLAGPAVERAQGQLPMGAVALPENDTFAALIGDGIRKVIDALADERRKVASVFGVRHLPTTEQWIAVHAGNDRGAGARAVPDSEDTVHLLRDGVIGSLVPLVSAAQLANVAVPVTESMITLAATILGADVAATGRRLDTIGIRNNDVDSVRRVMDAIARGER